MTTMISALAYPSLPVRNATNGAFVQLSRDIRAGRRKSSIRNVANCDLACQRLSIISRTNAIVFCGIRTMICEDRSASVTRATPAVTLDSRSILRWPQKVSELRGSWEIVNCSRRGVAASISIFRRWRSPYSSRLSHMRLPHMGLEVRAVITVTARTISYVARTCRADHRVGGEEAACPPRPY